MIALLPGVATVELPSESFDFLLGGSELSATYLEKIMSYYLISCELQPLFSVLRVAHISYLEVAFGVRPLEV